MLNALAFGPKSCALGVEVVRISKGFGSRLFMLLLIVLSVLAAALVVISVMVRLRDQSNTPRDLPFLYVLVVDKLGVVLVVFSRDHLFVRSYSCTPVSQRGS